MGDMRYWDHRSAGSGEQEDLEREALVVWIRRSRGGEVGGVE